MAFHFKISNAFDKALKKNKSLAAIISKELKSIIQNPEAAPMLHNSMKPLRCHHFGRKPEYRIIYGFYKECKEKSECRFLDITHSTTEEIANCEGLIDFIFVKTREECNNYYYYGKEYWNTHKRIG